MTGVVVTGLILTALVAGVFQVGWRGEGVFAAVGFGILATLVQVGAGVAMRGARQLNFAGFIQRWAVGMGLRMLTVLIMTLAVIVDRERFPPIPAASGLLGVLIPLLFLEARQNR